MRVTVTLNGTDRNPWTHLNLTRNPFPQIPKAEWAAANQILASLDSEPIVDKQDLTRRLKGCDTQFITLCMQMFEPGQRVRFDVEWPD